MTHTELVVALCKRGHEIHNEQTHSDAHLTHMALGIAGEAGEIVDVIKKKTIYQKPLDREHAVEELGDMEFFLEGLRLGLGITREETIEHNIKKLTIRYGKTYSNQAAQARIDKA